MINRTFYRGACLALLMLMTSCGLDEGVDKRSTNADNSMDQAAEYRNASSDEIALGTCRPKVKSRIKELYKIYEEKLADAKDKAHKKKLVAKRDESIDRLNAKECKTKNGGFNDTNNDSISGRNRIYVNGNGEKWIRHTSREFVKGQCLKVVETQYFKKDASGKYKLKK